MMRKPARLRPLPKGLVLIAYDTPSDKRRRRFSRAADDLGGRVQKSVFQAWADAHSLKKLNQRLEKTILGGEDSIFIIPCCATCRKKAVAMGLAEVWELPRYWIV